MIENRGSISLLGITSLFFLSLFSLHLIYLHSWRIKDSKQQIKLKLCSKRFFNQAKKYQSRMEYLNMSLKILNATKLALIPLLPESILAIRRIKNLIKILIKSQDAFSIYEKGQLNYLILKKCHLNIIPQFSFFYKSKGLKLIRDKYFDQAQSKKEWRGYFCQGRHLLSIQYKLDPEKRIQTSSYSIPQEVSKYWSSSLGCSLFQSFLSRY